MGFRSECNVKVSKNWLEKKLDQFSYAYEDVVETIESENVVSYNNRGVFTIKATALEAWGK